MVSNFVLKFSAHTNACVYLCMCFLSFFFASVLLLFVLSYSGLFVFILPYLIIFSLSLEASFLIRETKKGLDLNGLEGGEEPEETENGSHNQNVLYEKEYIFNEETKDKINFKIMQLTKTCKLQ